MNRLPHTLGNQPESLAAAPPLPDTESLLQAVVNAAVDAIVVIDDRGVVRLVNQATERIFGYAPAELIGQNINRLMPSPYREEHDHYLTRYLRTGQRRIIGIGREALARRKDGTIFPIDLAVSEIKSHEHHYFAGIVRDITQRKQLERELVEIAAAEQRRIGQDLHDSTGQELTALGLLVDGLAASLAEQRSPEASLATKIANGLKRVLHQVREFSRGLLPVHLDSRGLPAALAELAALTNELHGTACRFVGDIDSVDWSPEVATQVFRIAQEAVANALRHAKANTIEIKLQTHPAAVLSVRDDGLGIGAESPQHRGRGLQIMRHRASIIGARLEITSLSPHGTLVTCKLNPHELNPLE